jgi:hypothetical protein
LAYNARLVGGVGLVGGLGLVRGFGRVGGLGPGPGVALAFGQAIFEQESQSRLDLFYVLRFAGVALAGDGNGGDSHTVARFVYERVQYDRRE